MADSSAGCLSPSLPHPPKFSSLFSCSTRLTSPPPNPSLSPPFQLARGPRKLPQMVTFSTISTISSSHAFPNLRPRPTLCWIPLHFLLPVLFPAPQKFQEKKMTIAIEQPQIEVEVEDKHNPSDDPMELVLDSGFTVPETNSFGHSFREYDAGSERQKTVEEFYRTNHIHQTYNFVKRMREEYGKLDRAEMSIWECIELLNEFIDDSDPDLDEPQIEHLLQTAEAIRKDYPDEDWLHLTGLIHDLGKVLLHSSFGQLPQWAVVGDTFPVGCAFDECNVHHKYFKENSDYSNPKYNTELGVYSEGCGLDNVLMSWGHDDYMYLVAKENKTTLPSAALFIIRYHSFYPLHRHGAYQYLVNDEDKENLKWLHIFNKYDLYSKSKVRIDVEKVKPYYLSLIEKYFPAKLKW